MKRLRKSLVIGLLAVVVSTLGIQASDLLRGVEGNLVGLVKDGTGPCGPGAEQLFLGSRALCVDIFEASPGPGCPINNPNSPGDTQNNLNEPNCQPTSVKGVGPWRYISFTQAQQLCARSDKRLPTNDEWYKAVSGLTKVDSCVIDTANKQPQETGSAGCVSPLGIHDMVGNVWEWIDEEVVDGIYNNRLLPETGYVAAVDSKGVVVETASKGQEAYGKDYAQTSSNGVKVFIRGGFYGSGEDAGIFAQNMSVSPSLSTAGIGFRCVKDI